MCVRASAVLADEGVHRRVVGLRWLMPLPIDEMAGEGIVTALVENGFGGRIIGWPAATVTCRWVAPRTPCCSARTTSSARSAGC
jgi:hypothetical protein